jgi:hypothetical protein
VSFFPPVTMHDLRVTLPRMPRPATVRSLRHGRAYGFAWHEDRLTVEVPMLELFDAIQIVA